MNKMFRQEISRAVRTPRFWGAVLIGLGFLAFGVFQMIDRRSRIPEGYSFADLWYYAYSIAYFPYILPLIAVMPFADSLAEERAEGFFNQMAFRGGYQKTLTVKLIVNALAAALAVLIPLAVLYLFVNTWQPRASFPLNEWEAQISGRPYGVWMDLFMTRPDTFILMVSLLAGFMSALYATFGMAISLLTVNRYLVWALPVSFYLLSHFVATKTRLFGVGWSPAVAILGESWYGIPSKNAVWFHPLAMAGLITLIILFSAKRERVLTEGGF